MDLNEDKDEVSSTVDSNEAIAEAYLREFPTLKFSKEAKATAKKTKEANASRRAELKEYYQSQIKLTGTSEVSTAGSEASGVALQKGYRKM